MVFAQARANKKSMKNDLTESIKRASLGSEEEFLNANANANHAQGKSHANAINVNHTHQDEPLGMKKAPSSVSSVPQFGGWDQRDPGSTNYSMVFAQARANKKSMKNDLTESIKRASLGSEEEFLNANANANHAQGKSHANAINVNHTHQDEPLGMGRRRIPTFIDCCIRPRYVIE
ncbi:uncharacterized protein LOC107632328 isoform X2 [Arachis ipaensis]|uniref:uncharacterized protein LOC107632328 isoform X2 n=1 Tax=Arachis ipaensis TaxID=130454 RepID=UPI000A2B5F71|nr:uncharacterized protein LOC107632328 isoform X2 [Arachis ipaensis]